MTPDQIIEQPIEENYRSRPWLGVVPVERAIAAAIDYRHSLTADKQHLFDEAILKGWLPERAIDLIEYVADQGLIPDQVVTQIA